MLALSSQRKNVKHPLLEANFLCTVGEEGLKIMFSEQFQNSKSCHYVHRLAFLQEDSYHRPARPCWDSLKLRSSCIAAPDSVVVFSDSTEQIILTLSEENRLRGSKSVVSACAPF